MMRRSTTYTRTSIIHPPWARQQHEAAGRFSFPGRGAHTSYQLRLHRCETRRAPFVRYGGQLPFAQCICRMEVVRKGNNTRHSKRGSKKQKDRGMPTADKGPSWPILRLPAAIRLGPSAAHFTAFVCLQVVLALAGRRYLAQYRDRARGTGPRPGSRRRSWTTPARVRRYAQVIHVADKIVEVRDEETEYPSFLTQVPSAGPNFSASLSIVSSFAPLRGSPPLNHPATKRYRIRRSLCL